MNLQQLMTCLQIATAPYNANTDVGRNMRLLLAAFAQLAGVLPVPTVPASAPSPAQMQNIMNKMTGTAITQATADAVFGFPASGLGFFAPLQAT